MSCTDLRERVARLERNLAEIISMLDSKESKVEERRYALVHFAPADPIPFSLLLDRSHQ